MGKSTLLSYFDWAQAFWVSVSRKHSGEHEVGGAVHFTGSITPLRSNLDRAQEIGLMKYMFWSIGERTSVMRVASLVVFRELSPEKLQEE